jgi:hypothetical protein
MLLMLIILMFTRPTLNKLLLMISAKKKQTTVNDIRISLLITIKLELFLIKYF